MRVRSVVSLLTLLLWFTAVHHCALEQFGKSTGFADLDISQTSPDNSEDGACPSHKNSGTDSHTHGQLCGISTASTSNNVQLLPTPDSFIWSCSTILSQSFEQGTIVGRQINPNPFLLSVARSLTYSLSLASNAPPIR